MQKYKWLCLEPVQTSIRCISYCFQISAILGPAGFLSSVLMEQLPIIQIIALTDRRTSHSQCYIKRQTADFLIKGEQGFSIQQQKLYYLLHFSLRLQERRLHRNSAQDFCCFQDIGVRKKNILMNYFVIVNSIADKLTAGPLRGRQQRVY